MGKSLWKGEIPVIKFVLSFWFYGYTATSHQTSCRAKLTLQRAAERVAEELAEPLLLEFSGVGSFGKRVVFALLKEGTAKEKLTRVAGQSTACFLPTWHFKFLLKNSFRCGKVNVRVP